MGKKKRTRPEGMLQGRGIGGEVPLFPEISQPELTGGLNVAEVLGDML